MNGKKKKSLYILVYTLFFITADFKGNIKLVMVSKTDFTNTYYNSKGLKMYVLLLKISNFIIYQKNLHQHNKSKSDLIFKPRTD